MQHTQELWFHTGSITNTKDGRRFIPVHSICSILNPVLCSFYQLHMPSQDVLPHHPCSGSANEPFLKYLKRASLQINIWMTAHVAKPPMKSAVLFGWEDRNALVPVYFKDQMSSDFLQDLVCSCKGKSVCMKGCICF